MTQKNEQTVSSRAAWWKGARGEWYVVAQVAFIGLVFFGPPAFHGWPVWPPIFAQIGTVVGGILMAIGLLLFCAGLVALGRNLTPLPHPKENATLVESGPYRFARHPIYGGGMLLSLGWALLIHGSLTLLYVVILFVFLDIKSRREEQWLQEKFPGYAAYRQRVSKLIPFVY